MKKIILILLFGLVYTLSYAQKWDTTIHSSYIEYCENSINIINTFFEVDSFDCSKRPNTLYFYWFNEIGCIQRLDKGLCVPPHYLLIWKMDENKATIYHNFQSKDVKPKLGWENFKDSLNSLNLNTLYRDFNLIPFAKIKAPDSPSFILMICDKEKPKYYSFLSGLEIIPSEEGSIPNINIAKNQIKRIEKLISLMVDGYE
jgi:hypothetical protein